MSDVTILIVDDAEISRGILTNLFKSDYEIRQASDGAAAWEMLNSGVRIDLILLDLIMPQMDGVKLLEKIKTDKRFLSIPIIVNTQQTEAEIEMKVLELGADDYMTKPFAIEELLARIRVIFKRVDNYKASKPQNDSILRIKGVNLDIDRYTVTYKEKNIDLTKREFELLKYMMQNKNLVITREMILAKVWGYEYMGDTNVVDVYIRYLRSKIDDQFGIKLIHTIRGVGYQIKDE